MITGLVLFKAEKGKIPRLATQLGSIEEVVEVLSITGEYDLMAKIQVKEYERLSDIVTDKMQNTEGVLATRTMMAFKTYKFRELGDGAPAVSMAPPSAEDAAATIENGKKTIKPILSKLTENFDLERTEIYDVIDAINAGQLSDVQIAGFLVGMLNKGPSIKEVAYIAQAMRKNCIPMQVSVQSELTDTCGTGGGLTTFNVSTANAILTASAGVPVAKHGSRSISSPSGSADVLEALGVRIDLKPEQAARLIEEIGISFIYAPNFHPVMLKVFGPENQLGIKTIFFTIIGPLINPTGARNHTIGVYKPELVGMMANVIAEMDFNHVIVAHGMDGLDEISLIGKTSVAEIRNKQIKYFEVTPEDFGLKRCALKEIAGGPPPFNAGVIRDIFAGKDRGPRRDFLVLNNAAALYVSGKASSIQDGIALSRSLIDS
ncbi:MAG TPA: anthranilate phosphoribosyltransferase, partial [Thermodesulfobacteriota bacterium]|nr:anthranilate phosphoribosyltransferase [Thermodesulfobacteriota bacterium]